MMIIRPIQPEDKTVLLQLATKTGTGFTSLPNNEQRIQARIERMLATWDNTASPAEQGYLFALENSQTGQVVGISGIEVAIGLDEPWYDFHVGTQVHASKELAIYTQMQTLTISNDHTGCSELCTLFLDPEHRENNNGHLLSKSRFMFIAAFQDKFSERLIAEMRGINDDNNQSPFWESLGRHFFAIDFQQADYLTGIGQKSFIAELMPKHTLYVEFLSDEARSVMAQVHPNTAPARRILESEGMRYEGYVDIFDAGPTLEAYTQDLRIIKYSQLRQVKLCDSPLQADNLMLLSNDQYQTFRATVAQPQVDDHHVYLTPQQAEALNVSAGEPLRVVALFNEDQAHAAR